MGKRRGPKDEKAKVPGWMVSFGDMMTLILTFFILLVSMSREQTFGMVARGIGSFMVSAESYGLDGLLDGSEKNEIFNEVRVRFNLPPVENPMEPDDEHPMATSELVRADDIDKLPPRNEIFQPSVAIFAVGSSELSSEAAQYLDLLAPSLRPRGTQVLVLEAQAGAGEASGDLARNALALARARAVRKHLEEHHGYQRARLEVRAWISGLDPGSNGGAAVDARLILEPD
ncbi:flagellar motor protein MotB [Engelhardtia mirabilis]|uniref:Flagellar motor protein MotS n=1 Tax=Engelhardtia mirabilis TaxID=2528011 RepID=A0A518BST7_9BACT|nr:flagellar motor protein MotS [Planctomycetes bacterium Pla133]QDV04359.1 flagellar motor protein MotS [Planctomycetes bacterium Pla86]